MARAFDVGPFVHRDLAHLGIDRTPVAVMPVCTYVTVLDSPFPDPVLFLPNPVFSEIG